MRWGGFHQIGIKICPMVLPTYSVGIYGYSINLLLVRVKSEHFFEFIENRITPHSVPHPIFDDTKTLLANLFHSIFCIAFHFLFSSKRSLDSSGSSHSRMSFIISSSVRTSLRSSFFLARILLWSRASISSTWRRCRSLSCRCLRQLIHHSEVHV